MKLLIVIGIVCLIYVNLASSEANIDGTKPLEAEQNFLKLKNLKKNFKNKATDRLLKLKDETEFAKLMADEEEGSGDDDDYEDDEDYDEDEYDYDEDEYDYEEGSGEDVLNFDDLPITSKEVNVPLEADDNDKSDDFHFVEDKINHKKVSKEDFLYEYYNDLLYGNEDDEYLQELEQDLGKDFMNVDNAIVEEDVIVTETNTGNANGTVIRPAYISLMLASALVSFALFTLMFILCRKSMLERQQKQKSVPFVVTSGSSSSRYSAKHSTPIVKNYQRVPTSTKEMMLKQQSTVELGITSDTQKPLLTWKKENRRTKIKAEKKSIFNADKSQRVNLFVCFFPKYLIYKINLLFLLQS